MWIFNSLSCFREIVITRASANFRNICAVVHERASEWNLSRICCYVTLSCANWRLLWSKRSTWTLFTYPLGPRGLHYKRAHYLWVTQSNLQARLLSKLGRADLCMLMKHPLCGAGRVLGQQDSDDKQCLNTFLCSVFLSWKADKNTTAIYWLIVC